VNRPLAVVTGASRGIGAGVARRLALEGWDLVLTARASATADRAVARVREAASSGARIEWMPADLSRMGDVARLAAAVKTGAGLPHLLLNCAAITPREERSTEDGFEMQWAVNHLAPMLLTLLLPGAAHGGDAPRVVTVSSKLHRRGEIRPDGDLFRPRNYDMGRCYADTKLANVLFARALGRREGPDGRLSVSVHPGVAGTRLNHDLSGTRAVDRAVNRMIRTVKRAEPWGLAECVDTVAAVCLDPLGPADQGGYHEDGSFVEPSPAALDEDVGDALWSASARALSPWLGAGRPIR
jgi:NAD(P)-dependent dehydrogenase (short-subunit alcohol dehydrogenase family)